LRFEPVFRKPALMGARGMRAIYNRSQKQEYGTRDGKFPANGSPTPPQHKCSQRAASPGKANATTNVGIARTDRC
jgi:hypothetical protein